MEPFNVIEAPKLAMDLFAKTLGSNSHIKTFQARKIHIHRESPGAVHYDGDPIEMGTDIDVVLHPRGLKAIINPDAIEDDALPGRMVNTLSSLVDKVITY